MTNRLQQIRTTPWLATLLRDAFDFDLSRDEHFQQVHLPNGDPLTPIAGDASGGTFLLTPSGAVVYAGSEGEGGLIALNLRDALALVVGLPSVSDALARPLDDDLLEWLGECDEEIRQADEELRQDDTLEGRDRPTLDEARARAQQALDLPPAYDLLAELHAAAADDAFRPIGEDGPYDSMLQY